MSGKKRIAVGQISSESSHFVSFLCELELFRETGFLYEGDELFRLAGTDGEVGGMLDVLARDPGVEVVPLVAARANSSGPLSVPCYTYLRDALLGALAGAGEVDGVLLSHHGSMAAVGEDDSEGAIAAAVWEIVGPEVPLVMTLDLHGTVTPRMVEHTTAILGYEQYPHHDTFHTGERAASLLMRVLSGEARPAMALARLSLIATAFHASTQGDGPFADLMRAAKDLERDPGILSTSLFFVGSYIDVPEMCCSAVVIANGDPGRARREASALGRAFWERRRDFDVDTLTVAEAVARGREISGGPVLLLDTADTTGGGAAGDSIDLVRKLLEAGVTESCLAMVVDPGAARVCVEAGEGRTVTLDVGHRVDPAWGTPLRLTGRVLRTLDGRFRYTGGILGGTWASMGPSAVLQVGSVELLIMTYPTYDWADEQYRAAGLDAARAKFVGVKNMMNFRHGYRDVMKGYFVLDLPGPTPQDMRALPFRRIARPIYPLDEDLRGPEIRVTLSPAAGSA
jgi:microcystin degradation protein MlrC